MTNKFGISQPVRRREDARLITGKGSFADDVNVPGQARAVFLRSSHGHGLIRAIHAGAARNAPGVLAVLTGEDLRAAGESEQRLYSLDAWAECPYYNDRERAALAWTEAVTLVADGHVPDAVYEQVRPFFSEKELGDLTLAVATINVWNRLNIAARTEPGTYQPGKTLVSNV